MSFIARWATPAAVLLSILAAYCAPEAGGFALAALTCWGLALAFST